MELQEQDWVAIVLILLAWLALTVDFIRSLRRLKANGPKDGPRTGLARLTYQGQHRA